MGAPRESHQARKPTRPQQGIWRDIWIVFFFNENWFQGFGGKFGVQTDRVDKSAHMFDETEKVSPAYTKVKPDIGKQTNWFFINDIVNCWLDQ